MPAGASLPVEPTPRAARAIVIAALPVHLALALVTDLSPDEAYYLAAARRPGAVPDLVDHPPLVPWLLRLTDRFAWAPVELRVRIWAALFALATGLACVELARRRGAGRAGCIAAAWIGSWALLPTAGGFVTTPDGAALAAIAAALLLAGAATPAASLAAGAALFAGALSKVVALPVALAIAVTARPRSRARAAIALVPLLALPLLLPSLRFQLRHAYGGGGGAWSALGAAGAVAAAALAQALLWSPPVVWLGVRALPGLPLQERAVFWTLTALVLASAAVRGVPPEPNWWAPAALAVVVAFARAAGELTPRARRAILASVVLPTALAASHTVRPFLPLPARADPTARLHGWSNGDRAPIDAAGVGPYGPAAERCVYRADCVEMNKYFDEMSTHE